MRFVVVDRARRAGAQKRGAGEAHLALEDADLGRAEDAELVLGVHQAVERLATFNERLARLVECRFFVGLNDEETGRALGVTARTVQRDWLRAQAWLRSSLESPAAGS
jgi:RNA polymerase sigma factor (TIGR02999 family)